MKNTKTGCETIYQQEYHSSKRTEIKRLTKENFKDAKESRQLANFVAIIIALLLATYVRHITANQDAEIAIILFYLPIEFLMIRGFSYYLSYCNAKALYLTAEVMHCMKEIEKRENISCSNNMDAQ